MKNLLLFSLVTLAFLSCKKETNSHDGEYYKLLVDKKWSVVADTEEDATGKRTDVFQYWNYWELDDHYRWYSNGNYCVNDGQNLHPGNFQQILDSGSWVLSGGTITEYSLNTFGTHYPATITDITTDTLKIKVDYYKRNVMGYISLVPVP